MFVVVAAVAVGGTAMVWSSRYHGPFGGHWSLRQRRRASGLGEGYAAGVTGNRAEPMTVDDRPRPPRSVTLSDQKLSLYDSRQLVEGLDPGEAA